MNKTKLSQTWFNELSDELEKLFPKGECKERGAALVLFAYAYKMLDTAIKAFGGCDKCYGKGYGTSLEFIGGRADFYGESDIYQQTNPITFCKCPRGKQLFEVFGKKKQNA